MVFNPDLGYDDGLPAADYDVRGFVGDAPEDPSQRDRRAAEWLARNQEPGANTDASIDAYRYKQAARDANNVRGPETDYTRANEDYGRSNEAYQEIGGATGLARMAASGEGPTAARAATTAGIESGLMARMRSASSGKGQQRAAASYGAAAGGLGHLADAAAGGARMRAGEVAQGRSDYLAGTGAMTGAAARSRGLSQRQAQFQTDTELAQRRMNAGREGMFLGAAGGARATALAAAQGDSSLAREQALRQQARSDAQAAAAYNAASGLVGAFGDAAKRKEDREVNSDERGKNNMRAVGAVMRIMGRRY